MDFDFEEQEGADTASPFRQQSISRPLSPRLSKCMEAEAIQTDSFRGGVLQFTVLPSGKVGQVKLQKSGKVSAWVDKMRTESICRASVLSLQWIRTFSADTCAGE